MKKFWFAAAVLAALIGQAALPATAVADPLLGDVYISETQTVDGNTTVYRDATIFATPTVDGNLVTYTGSAVYTATSPGSATVACAATVIGAPLQVVRDIWCFLRDVKTGEWWVGDHGPYVHSAYSTGEFLLPGPARRTLEFCMIVQLHYVDGPRYCAPVA